MSEPRLHHYLPRFYLSGFANEAGLVWRWDRVTGGIKELHPAVVGAEKELYTIEYEDGRKVRDIEKVIAEHIDTPACDAIRRLAVEQKASLEDRKAIAGFVAMQLHRSPISLSDIESGLTQSLNGFKDHIFATPESTRAAVIEYEGATGENLGDSDELYSFVQSGAYNPVASRALVFDTIFPAWEMLAQELLRFEWSFLTIGSRRAFLTSDTPLTILPPHNAGGAIEAGIRTPGAVTFFPLTSQICLRIVSSAGGPLRRAISLPALRAINKNFAIDCDRFVFGCSRELVEKVITSASVIERPDLPRFENIVTSDSEGQWQYKAVRTFARFHHPEM